MPTAARRAAADRRALLALGVGSFAIGTGEFVIMGLLPERRARPGHHHPEAGHVISAYALGVVVGAPLLAVLTARWPPQPADRADGVLCHRQPRQCAGDYLSIMTARLCTGLPHGTYFGVAALVAAAQSRASAARRPWAWSCWG
jgi:DHA1 family inner membrane transport protein